MASHTLTSRFGLLAGAFSLLLLLAPQARGSDMALDAGGMRWQVVVDGVMGGLSSGEVARTREGIRFSGDLRLENNGGFSQIRTPIAEGTMDGADGIEIEVRGDGRTYIFDARVSNMQVMAGSYQHTFETKDGEWAVIRLPFDGFRFHYFGRLMDRVGAISPQKINSLGVTLADYNAGDFQLEVRSVRGYVEGDIYDQRLARLSEKLTPALPEPERSAASDDASPASQPANPRLVYSARQDRLLKTLGEREASPGSERRAWTGTVRAVSAGDAVVELCVLAIERGVPLFNNGQHAACAAVYEMALASVLTLGADTLGDQSRDQLMRGVRDGRALRSARDRSWHYRELLDGLIRSFNAPA